MIKAAIVALAGGSHHPPRVASIDVIRPVLGVEPAEATLRRPIAAGLETTPVEDALARPDIQASSYHAAKLHAAQDRGRGAAGSTCSARSRCCTNAREMEAVAEGHHDSGRAVGIGTSDASSQA